MTPFLPSYFNFKVIFLVAALPATETSATYPSFFRMPAMLSFMRECGISSDGNNARWALRILVSISEIGSVIKLPTGFRHSGNQSVQGRLTESQSRITKFSQVTVAASARRAAVDQAAWAGVAR